MNEGDYEDAVVNFCQGLYAFGYSRTENEDDASELTQETFYRLLPTGAMVPYSSKIQFSLVSLYRAFLSWEQRRVRPPHFGISKWTILDREFSVLVSYGVNK